MAQTRAKRDIDWSVNAPLKPDVAISRAWSSDSANFSNPVSSDNNRMGVLLVHNEDSAGTSQVTSLTVGGLPATPIVNSFNSSGFSNEFAAFYITDAQLNVIGTNPSIVVTFNNVPDVFTVGHVIYTNVNQSSLIVGTDNFEAINQTGLDTRTASAEDGGVSVLGVGGGQPFGPVNITANSHVQVLDISNSGGDAFIFEKVVTVGPSEAVTYDITGTANRSVIIYFNLRKA